MPNQDEVMGWEKEFDEKFKCIQGDCAGGHTYPSEGEPEGGQCQFCTEYLFPFKSFIATLLAKKREEAQQRIDKYKTDCRAFKGKNLPSANELFTDLLSILS